MIETDRLIIRYFEKTDLDDYFEFASDSRVGPNAAWAPHESKKETLRYIKMYKREKNVFAIVLKETNKVIGKIGLYKELPVADYFNKTQRELGFCINPKYWGCGYALEAAKALADFAFKTLDIDLLWCGHFYYNRQSESVIKRLNFNFYKEIIYDATDIGKRIPANMYYMMKDEYLNEVK